MFAEIAEQIVKKLEENQVIQSDDRELYKYGFEQIFMILLNLVTTLVIGSVFHCMVPILVFMAFYMFLRTYAGGYHAKTRLGCYTISTVILAASAFAVKRLYIGNTAFFIGLALSFMLTAFLAPVESENKPLDDLEVRVYRKRALIILFVETVAAAVLRIIGQTSVSSGAFYSLASVALLAALGKIINHARP